MIIEPDYRGFRIEVTAREANRGWDADVRIRRTLSRTSPLYRLNVIGQRPPTRRSSGASSSVANRWSAMETDSRHSEGRSETV